MNQTQVQAIFFITLALLVKMSTLSPEFISQLRIVSPLSSKPLDLTDGQEVVYSRRRTFHLLASSPSSDWSVCYFSEPNGSVCRLLHFDYDIPGCSEVSRDKGGSPTCRYEVNRPTDGNWTNSLFVFNETSGDFDVKSVRLRALVKSRLSTNKKRIKLRLDQSTEVQCTAERGYPAPKISWKYGYTLLVPYDPLVDCDDFSCSTESRLNFTARRVGKSSLTCISTQTDTLGNGTHEIPVTVLPAPKAVLKSGLFITCLFFGILIFLCLIFLLLYCLFVFFKRRKRQTKMSSAPLEIITEGVNKPFTIYNPPSVTSSSAYFSSGSDDAVFLSSSDGEKTTKKVKEVSDSELCNDDELFEYEWEGWGPPSHSSSLSDIICHSSSQNESDPDDLVSSNNNDSSIPDYRHLGPQLLDLAQIYDDKSPPSTLYSVPLESWV